MVPQPGPTLPFSRSGPTVFLLFRQTASSIEGRALARFGAKRSLNFCKPAFFLGGAGVATTPTSRTHPTHHPTAPGRPPQRAAHCCVCMGRGAAWWGGGRRPLGPRGRGWQVPPLTLPPNGRWGNPTGSIFRIFWQRERSPTPKVPPNNSCKEPLTLPYTKVSW